MLMMFAMKHPPVNALDDYAVGFTRLYKPTVDEIMNDSFIGIVKYDVVPPNDIYIPVLPGRIKASDGSEQLMFQLEPMSGAWASVEIKNGNSQWIHNLYISWL